MRLLNQPSVAVVPTKVIKWVKPNANKVKVQYDASVRGNGFVGIGFVARDSHELILGAGVDIILGNISMDLCGGSYNQTCYGFYKQHRFTQYYC